MKLINASISDDALIERFCEFCVFVDSPLSRKAIHAVRHNPVELKELAPEPCEYSTVESFALDFQVYSFLKKFKNLPGLDDKYRKRSALTSWSAGEQRCFKSNQRIRALLQGDCTLLTSPLIADTEQPVVTLATIISMAQRKIEQVLGPFRFKEVAAECRWSAGSTVDLPRGTMTSKKMTERITVSERAFPHLERIMRGDPAWLNSIHQRELRFEAEVDIPHEIVEHDKYLTVDKNAFTFRAICPPPTGNAFLQQGVGRFIRRRLKRWDVDLDDQSWNRYLASIAGRLGYSTLDLRGASDSVSFELVRLMLPVQWFDYLSDLRTPFTIVNGKRIKLEKFSAMGNAFTFELESLIFWSLASSLNEAYWELGGSVGVYGDDIVVKRDLYAPLVSILEFFGFEVNTEKSFLDGNFFESCGGNYFMGDDVTGFSQVESLSTLPEIIRFHNRSVRWSMRVLGRPFTKVVKKLVRGLTDGVHKIPLNDVSDDGFLSSYSELGRYCPNHGYRCHVVVFEPSRETQVRQSAFYAYKLRRRAKYRNSDPRGQPIWTSSKLGDGAWVSAIRWTHGWV